MAAIGRVGSGDFAFCPKHNCGKCSKCHGHPVQGPPMPSVGAHSVFINGHPALLLGDGGVHDKQTCCGPNRWIAHQTVQQRKVIIEGREVFCVGDITLHDQKDIGHLMCGSSNVFAA